jgi:hypothetical protein
MEFYWNNVTEKSGLLKPSDITDCMVYARPIYARFTVCTLCKGNETAEIFSQMTHNFLVQRSDPIFT